MLYLCRVKPLRHYLRGFLIAAWAGDKIAEFSFPEISFHFSLRPWFFFVSPAYAGKSPAAAYACPGTQDHPRVCGEKLYTPCVIAPSVGSPPRMRGKGGLAGGRTVEHGITPAYAGKASGAMSGSDMDRITPAYAGKSCKASQAHLRRWDHPRVCGEKRTRNLSVRSRLGSPPHVRGKEVRLFFLFGLLRITPACAGKSQR